LPFRDSAGQLGQLVINGLQPPVIEPRPLSYRSNREVPCFPLESLLLALNRTRIDYLSLDVEGLELDVLETIPWTRFDIRTMSVEHKHVPRGKQAIHDYMIRQGYQLVVDLHSLDPDRMIFVDDFIFAKPGMLMKSRENTNRLL
jgi:Methyltransferase FkbM domain